MDQFIDWVYSQLVGFFGNFFAEMGNMGVELFEMSWVQSVVLFFSYLAWALYGTGLVVACFECGIEYSTGRGNVKEIALNAIKGFMAVSLFTVVPVRLYELSVTLQASLTSGITGYGESFDALSTDIINSLQGVDIGAAASSGVFGGIGSITSPHHGNFYYHHDGVRRHQVLFLQPQARRSLTHPDCCGFPVYVLGAPRLYGRFCAVVQADHRSVSDHLPAGHHPYSGTAGAEGSCAAGPWLMLSAGEVPRICGAFGLDTSTRANIMSAVYAAQSAVNTTRTVVQAVGAAK